MAKTSRGVIVAYSLAVFVIMEPAWFSEFPMVDKAFIAGKLLLLLAAGLFFFRHKIPNLLLFVTTYGVLLFANTILHNGDGAAALSTFINTLCLVAVTSVAFKAHREEAFRAFLCVFELLILCNLISVIYAPTGLYTLIQSSGWWTDACWFLGLRNGMTPIYVMAAFLEYANVLRNDLSKTSIARCIIFSVVATASVLLINKSTALISATSSSGGLLLIWFFVLACPLIGLVAPIRRTLNFTTATIANFTIAFLLVVIRFQNLFSYIIVTVLGKDLTLSSRTTVWDSAFQAIDNNWFFGYGLEEGPVMSSRLGNIAAVNTTQNGWLDVLYVGGIMLLAVLIAIFGYSCKQIEKAGCDERSTYVIGYMSFLYLLTGQTESLVGARFFLFLTLTIYVAKLLGSGEAASAPRQVDRRKQTTGMSGSISWIG